MSAQTKSTLIEANRAFWMHACASALLVVPAIYALAILDFINN